MPKDKAYWKAYNQKRQAYLKQKKQESRQRLKALSSTALSLTHPVEKANDQRGEKTNKMTTNSWQYLMLLLLAFLGLANLLISMVALRSWTILPMFLRTLAIGYIFNSLLFGLYLILVAKKKPRKGGKK